MRVNRSVPPPSVVPVLVYPDVRAAVAFLTAAFGFVERTRVGDDHRVQMAVGADGAVIVADVGSRSVWIVMSGDDGDAAVVAFVERTWRRRSRVCGC